MVVSKIKKSTIKPDNISYDKKNNLMSTIFQWVKKTNSIKPLIENFRLMEINFTFE